MELQVYNASVVPEWEMAEKGLGTGMKIRERDLLLGTSHKSQVPSHYLLYLNYELFSAIFFKASFIVFNMGKAY